MSTLRDSISWRLNVIRNRDSPLSFWERLSYASTVKNPDYRTEFVLNHIKEDESGTKYLGFGKYHLYYNLDIIPNDSQTFMRGIVDTISECYFYPPPYFTSDFRPRCGDTVFDLGANIGTITLIMSKMVGDSGRVYSFEPATDRSLQKTISVNHLENCRVVPKAVSNKNGQIEIHVFDSLKNSNITMTKERLAGYHHITRVVESITLDSFVESNAIRRVDFIKMDIEGAEELAILGANQVIERFHPRWSIASYHLHGTQHSRLVELLRGRGYKVLERGGTHILAY